MASPSKRPRNTEERREPPDSSEMVRGLTTQEFLDYLHECNILRCRIRREFEGVDTVARLPEQEFTRVLRNIFRSWANLHFAGVPEGTSLTAAEFIRIHIATELREPAQARVIEEWSRGLRDSSPEDEGHPPTLGSDLILSFDCPSSDVALTYEVLYRMAELTEDQMEQRGLSPLILSGVVAGRIDAAGIDNRTLLTYFRVFLMLEARIQATKFIKLRSEKSFIELSKLSEIFKEMKKPTHTDQKRKEPGPSKELGECSTSQSKSMDIDAKLPQAKSVMSSLDQKISELVVKVPDPTKERGECSSAESGAKASVAKELPQAKGGMPSPDQEVSEREGKELDPTKERGECGSAESDAKGADKPLQAEGNMPSSDQKVSEQEGKEPDSTEEHGECSSAESGAKASDAEKPLQVEGEMPSSGQKVSEQERKEPDPTK